MKKLVLCAVVVALCGAVSARAESITLRLEGVKCGQCADEIISALEKVPTVKLKDKPSEKSPTAVLDVDLAKSDVGAIGKAVAAAETPHKAEEAPAAYLVVAAPGLTAANAKKLSDALKGVKGVKGALSGSDLKKKEITVRLDESGAAKIADIKKALADYTKK
jgi:copper chaperone CopZ